ncbi:MAG: HD family phosphohydrolase [Chlamydiia bacterium]
MSRWMRSLNDGLRENRRGLRLIIAGVFFLALFAFIHFREVQVEALEIETKASSYIVAQVDFSFPDEEATLILRQEALSDVSSIYQIDPKSIKEARLQVEDYFIRNKNWRGNNSATFEEIYSTIEKIGDELTKIRLTDERTVRKACESRYMCQGMIQVPIDSQNPLLSNDFWPIFLKEELQATTDRSKEAIKLVVDRYAQFANWNIEVDYDELRKFRAHIESLVEGKNTAVKAGSLIISEGDTVTDRHLRQLTEMKKQIRESRNLFSWNTLLGSGIIALLLTILVARYFRLYHKNIYYSSLSLSLFATIVILTLGGAKIIEYFLVENTQILNEYLRYPVLVPFAAILISILLNKQVALFSTFFLTIVMGLTLAVDQGRFLLINYVASLAAIFFSQSLSKRKEVFKVCGLLWLICVPIMVGTNLINSSLLQMSTVYDLGVTLGLVMVEAILIALVLPVFETTFNVMTDLRLMELMDPNNELIRRLCFEAPGTYQHSIMVGILAEAASLAIGANGLLCRVSALFHDIGKLFNPNYFTENQFGDFNVHRLLSPTESAMVIISHVHEGVELARKHKLPKIIIDMIQQHHGTTMVSFFYSKEIEAREGNVDLVDKTLFTYPGPKPQTKEAAVLMICDTVEAASRSLDEINEKNVEELVNRLVAQKIKMDQFCDSDISFKELEIVKKVVIHTLYVSRHSRIKYSVKNNRADD